MSDLYAPGSPPIYYQSLAIFFGYLAIAAGLIISIIRLIGARFQARQKKNEWASPQRRTQFYLFSILSALSLGFTWFHMIYMHVIVKIGLWLKNTYVFQEAWETVSENAARFWWSGQIFGWTIGWSIFLGITGRRYRIPHVWIYMLIAQAVSVSFAANLFFAAITVSQKPNEKEGIFAWSPALVYELLPVIFSILDTVAVPIFAYKKEFMWILLAPHAMVFVPCVLRPNATNSKAHITKVQGDQTTKRYAVFIAWIAAASVAVQAYLTALMLQEIGPALSYAEVAQQLLDTVYVHPACSSVSWDVIFCTLSSFAWAIVHGFDTNLMLGGQ
ncbi:hypothetical protein MYU51_001693 [Penicillium brevicompactum]